MKRKQGILLFVALLLPVSIFLFLKQFGENEFDVAPLYLTSVPELTADCPSAAAPYHIPDSILNTLGFEENRLVLVSFGAALPEAAGQLRRVREAFLDDGLQYYRVDSGNDLTLKRCVFLLKEPFDLVLVDNEGRIRGQYVSSDREETDRLITEITIILKKH